jgi:hypothetical protein
MNISSMRPLPRLDPVSLFDALPRASGRHFFASTRPSQALATIDTPTLGVHADPWSAAPAALQYWNARYHDRLSRGMCFS